MSTIIPASTPTPAPDERAIESSLVDPIATAREIAATAESPAPSKGRGKVEPRYRATGSITSKERQHLARLAREGWAKCGAQDAGMPFDEWRHDQVATATQGRAEGLTKIGRGMYREVRAHFLELAGHAARAFREASRSGQGAADRELAMAKLRQACESGELDYPSYPEAICRRQFRCSLDELETGRIWFLFYTCTQRARAKNRKAQEIASEGRLADSGIPTPKID